MTQFRLPTKSSCEHSKRKTAALKTVHASVGCSRRLPLQALREGRCRETPDGLAVQRSPPDCPGVFRGCLIDWCRWRASLRIR